MSRRARYFTLGFVGALAIFLAATLIAAHVQSDCGIKAVFGMAGCADDIRRVGFPWVVWEEGGFSYRNVFDPVALLLDIGVGLLVSVGAGILAQRFARS